eukprot:COSAG05_NODE_371_length_10705_cov_99.051475_1_plen_189_part_10
MTAAYENEKTRADQLAVRLVPSGQAGPKMVRNPAQERVRKQSSDKSRTHHGHAGLNTVKKRTSKACNKRQSGYWDLATGLFVPCVKKEGEKRNNDNLNAQKMAWRLSLGFEENTLKNYKIKFGLTERTSPWRLVTSTDMKVEEVGKATLRTVTRIRAWTNMDGAKYTLLVEWKTNIVAKVNSYGNFGLG